MVGAVVWTDLATREFEEAAAYIGLSSPAYAADFVLNVLEAVELIADWPESGAIVPEFGEPLLRELFVKQYRVIYRTVPDGICIVALIHGARDLGRLWNPRERASSG